MRNANLLLNDMFKVTILINTLPGSMITDKRMLARQARTTELSVVKLVVQMSVEEFRLRITGNSRVT